MDYEQHAVDMVMRAGELLRASYRGVQEIAQKGDDPRNEVTAADKALSRFLIEEIGKRFPEHGVYSEEGEGGESDRHTYEWAIDPIDGTSNFARAIPHFAICASLLKDGIPIAGAIHNPVTNELFTFDEKKGATCNGSSVRASSVQDPMKAQLFFHVGRKEKLFDWGATTMRSLLSGTKKIKDLGASGLDLAFLASGRADAVIYGTLTTQDIAGAIGMVRAAGGEVYSLVENAPVTFSTEPQTIVATSNRGLYDVLLPMLHADMVPRD